MMAMLIFMANWLWGGMAKVLKRVLGIKTMCKIQDLIGQVISNKMIRTNTNNALKLTLLHGRGDLISMAFCHSHKLTLHGHIVLVQTDLGLMRLYDMIRDCSVFVHRSPWLRLFKC